MAGSTDEKPPRSEVRRWGVILTWQNVVVIGAFLISAATVYFKMDARMAALEAKSVAAQRVLRHQGEWLETVAEKTGVWEPKWDSE